MSKFTIEDFQKARQRYIEDNKPCSIGDLVEVVDTFRAKKTFNCLVMGIKLDYSDNIIPTLRMIKKNGQLSLNSYHFWEYTTITVLEHNWTPEEK